MSQRSTHEPRSPSLPEPAERGAGLVRRERSAVEWLDVAAPGRVRLPCHIPYVPLATLPTPIQRAEGLEDALSHRSIFIKRDDLSGHPYGGNKVRKLELLLAAAQQRGAGEVLTVGALGSNHVLATAVYARQVGLGSRAVGFPRPLSDGVVETVLATRAQGTDLHLVPSPVLVPLAVGLCLARSSLRGLSPMYIPGGGSSALGSIGYVLAALELAEQVRAGQLPEPDRIYVTLGSCGTAAGLLAGLRLAGLRSRLVAVRVVPRIISNGHATVRLANATLALLARMGYHHGARRLTTRDLTVVHDQAGGGYGAPTGRAAEAIALAAQHGGLHLEQTYTGKTLAALVADGRSGRLGRDATVLFWNTYSSLPLGPLLPADASSADLPRAVRRALHQ